MKLLFNKQDSGDAELKALIPYVDADLSFLNMKPDITTSTYDIIKLIGKEVYQISEDSYYADTDKLEIEAQLIEAICRPIAVNGYRLYAPTNDLSHTNNGRKMRSDDSEKTPFEWMIDRDNAAQEKRYYRALDDLILFLDSLSKHEAADTPDEIFENKLFTQWTTSTAFKSTHNLFIRTVDEFDTFFPIQSRLLLFKLVPGIALCELYEILPRLGRTKFDELKSKLQTNQAITELHDIHLLKLIKQASVAYAMAWALPRYSVGLFPDGVLQHYTSDKATTRGQKPALNLEPEVARMAFQSDCDKALLEIEVYLMPAPEIDTSPMFFPETSRDDKFLST